MTVEQLKNIGGDIPTTNNITQCVAGGNVQDHGIFIMNIPPSRYFSPVGNYSPLYDIPTYSDISPVTVRENVQSEYINTLNPPSFTQSNCSLYNRAIQLKHISLQAQLINDFSSPFWFFQIPYK